MGKRNNVLLTKKVVEAAEVLPTRYYLWDSESSAPFRNASPKLDRIPLAFVPNWRSSSRRKRPRADRFVSVSPVTPCSELPVWDSRARRAFATASAAMMAAYTFGVLVLSLGGQVEHDLIGSPNALLNGTVLALFPIVLGPVGIVAKRLSPRVALGIGSAVSVLGMGLLALAVGRHDLLIFLAGTASVGAAYSLLFVGGLGLVNAAGSSHHRGAVFSALYLVGYFSMGALALVLGVVATAWGLGLAVDLGAAAIAIVSVATLDLAVARPRPVPGEHGRL
jgi:hypothetical protein